MPPTNRTRGIGGRCFTREKDANLLADCSYRAKTCERVGKRSTHKLFDYSSFESVVWTHSDSPNNEISALRERHQLYTGKSMKLNGKILAALDELVQANGGYEPLEPRSAQAVIDHYTGPKREEYRKGWESLLVEPLCKKDAEVRMFLKDDKYHLKQPSELLDGEVDKFGPPRCIQFRNKRYGVLLARYLHGVEERTYNLRDVTGSRVFAKSRNLDERAADIVEKWESFTNPVALCLDHSKFDCHVQVGHLKEEHEYYKRWYKSSNLLTRLLRMQIVNKGVTHTGLTYKTKGTRMSGDQNTGLGNSVINYGMLRYYTRKVKAAFYIDGDDSVIIVDRADLKHCDFDSFEKFGMSTKLDIVTELERIEFCQCRPVFDGVSWHFTRNPYRALARMPWVTNRRALNHIPRHIKSVGMCEVALNYGMPVMQAIGWKLIRFGAGKYIETDRHYEAKRMKVKPWNIKEVGVKDVTRRSYECAWGLTPDQQMALENMDIMRPASDPVITLGERLPSGFIIPL